MSDDLLMILATIDNLNKTLISILAKLADIEQELKDKD